VSPALLRVALVCPYSWSVPGGVQSHVAGLARALRAAGLEVDVLAPADERACDGVVVLGRSVRIPDNGSVPRVALSPRAAARTARLVRGGGYDLVHLHEPLIPAACLTALLTAREPLVGTFHRYSSSVRWYRLFAPLCRLGVCRLQVRVAVSAAARDHAARVCPGDYEIVPNGIELPPAGREHRGPGTTVVFVGRPEPRKGLRVLLEAFRRLPPPARLEFVGVAERELRAVCDGLRHFPARVVAHGRLSDDERTRRLLAADVLGAPSLGGESFGLALAEGMAVGLPVVASDVGGYGELVTDDCGRLVPAGDPDALARALRDLLDAPELRARLGAAARRRVEPLAWPRVAELVL
jgi:phosphatidylinositol alpha-mannosyltransferase